MGVDGFAVVHGAVLSVELLVEQYARNDALGNHPPALVVYKGSVD
jgi:hypothetical protein